MSLLRRSAPWGLAALVLLLLLFPSRAQPVLPKLPDALFKRWIHSYEEDSPGFRVFRPTTFEFPPARGRLGFEIRRDGTFSRFDFARGDGSKEELGTWKVTAADAFVTSFSQPELNEEMRILSCNAAELRVARRTDP